MRKLLALALVATFVASACGSDNKATVDAPDVPADVPIDQPIDAQSFDFSCMNTAMPTTAAAMITITGTVTEPSATPPFTPMPLAGATVDICTADCTGAADPSNPKHPDRQTSAATTGAFTTVPLATGGVPLDAYVLVSNGGTYRPSRLYPPAPFTADVPAFPTLILTKLGFGIWVSYLGGTQSNSNGAISLLITDCAYTPLPSGMTNDVVVTVKSGGNPVGGTPIDVSKKNMTATGAWFVFDVPPGDVEVAATYKGMALRPRIVGVAMGETTGTIIRPGF
jgi:hypothetical protein